MHVHILTLTDTYTPVTRNKSATPSRIPNMIQAEGDADVEIVKAAVTKSAFKSTTNVGEYTDLLPLLL